MPSFTTLVSADLDPESPINTTMVNAFYDNVLAIVSGDATASSYRVQQAAMAASSIGQSELKTTTNSASTTNTGYVVVNFVGPYSFSPEIRISNNTYFASATWMDTTLSSLVGVMQSNITTFEHTIAFKTSINIATAYIQVVEVDACPPYEWNEDLAELFIYIIMDGDTAESISVAYNPPWCRCNELHADRYVNVGGLMVPYKYKSILELEEPDYKSRLIAAINNGNRRELDSIVDRLATDRKELIELTPKMKNKYLSTTNRHVFSGNDFTTKKIIMLDPSKTSKLARLHKIGVKEDVAELMVDGLIRSGKLKIDSTPIKKGMQQPGVPVHGFKL